MSNYKIFVDTGADMPNDVRVKNDIGLISFLSIFGEDTYRTGVDITNEEFYQKLEGFDGIPTTSQTPYGEMLEILSNACNEYETVIYCTLSSNASGQYHSACMIKDEILEENPNAKLYIVDSKSFSVFISEMALKLKELLDNGAEVEEAIQKAIEFKDSYDVFILVDSLKYLEKGGRIRKTSAIIGSLLDIKPVLSIRDGLIEAVEKLRGRKKIYKKLVELIRESDGFDENDTDFIIADSSKVYKEELKEVLIEEFNLSDVRAYYELGALIGSHIGPGTVAVIYRKSR